MKTYVTVLSAAIAALASLFRQTSPWLNVGGRPSCHSLGNSRRAIHCQMAQLGHLFNIEYLGRSRDCRAAANTVHWGGGSNRSWLRPECMGKPKHFDDAVTTERAGLWCARVLTLPNRRFPPPWTFEDPPATAGRAAPHQPGPSGKDAFAL